MSILAAEQVDRLTSLMDARFERELKEIDAITARSRGEREQELLAGRPADQLDAVLTRIAAATDDAMARQDAQDVLDILAARRRLAAGTYGSCVDCGRGIAYERLLAYPTAKRCIDCQRAYEGRGRSAPG